MEQEVTSSENRALDILEAGAGITEQQLNELRHDDALRRDVQDLLAIKAKMRMGHVDVEERLNAFHKKRMHKGSKARIFRMAALAAAVVAAVIAFSFWKSASDASMTMSEMEKQLAKGFVFTADEEQTGISLTNENGQKVTLSPKTKQNTDITIDDFRKIFADKEHIESVTLEVPYGKSASVTLPDGSVAYLHPNSRVIFPTEFVGRERVVKLSGRAYFKVAKNAEHPFIVMTDMAQTTVLGTEFDINTMEGEITLISGSIRVNAKESQQEVVLKPGQQVTIADNNFHVGETDIVPYEYWRDGYLYFDNVDLKTIMEAIGENFNMTVEFRNKEALNLKMRFISERNNGVDAAINMMNRMKKAYVFKEGNKIIVE